LRSGALTEPLLRQACRLLAERYRLGSEVPPIIVVSAADDAPTVVLEGCTRLTALFWEGGPDEAQALLGVGPEMTGWAFYGPYDRVTPSAGGPDGSTQGPADG
ncbi:MAG: hypothetical protein M3T56_11745, partial [Chloroflexota bacterium]|nr:hypothetical protein [Chloroflexota bacterium]